MGDASQMLDVIEALQHGALERLSPEQQLRYYVHECERMGLDPAARPLEWVRLSGKLTLYARRVAADMLAAKHRATTTLLEGPEVRDFGGTKLLYAKARATMPDGRSADDVATLPAQDLANGVMKTATKALRRATLRLCGWGGLDESELETIPAREMLAAPAPARAVLEPRVTEPVPDWLADVRDEVAELGGTLTVDQAAAVACDAEDAHAAALRDPDARTALDRALQATLPDGTPTAAYVRACAAERHCRDYARATSLDEVEAITAEVAGLKLPKRGCPERDRLGAALRSARARLAPTPEPDGDGPRGGQPAPSHDAPADVAGSAAPASDAAGAVMSAEAWTAHLTRHATPHAVAGALRKYRAGFQAAGVFAQREAVAANRVAAMPALGDNDPLTYLRSCVAGIDREERERAERAAEATATKRAA